MSFSQFLLPSVEIGLSIRSGAARGKAAYIRKLEQSVGLGEKTGHATTYF